MFAFIESALVFLAGLLVRFALMALVVAIFAIPILFALKAWGGLTALWRRVHGVGEVAGLPWRSGLHYARSHTWLAGSGDAIRVGLDGLAQRLLGEVRQVVLPPLGLEVHAGEVVATLGSNGRRAPIISPISGKVTAVNEKLHTDPSRTSRDPYLSGWLFSVAPTDHRWEALPFDEGARLWFRGEAERLHRLLEGRFGLAAADGGEFLLPPASSLPDSEWKALTETFLNPPTE